MSATESAVRLDKWLWAVRAYKSRNLAIEGIRGGHVKINGERAKPAHAVKVGEQIFVRRDDRTLILRVKALLGERVGAALVGNYCDDLSPPETIEEATTREESGEGRPDKRQRREIHRILWGTE